MTRCLVALLGLSLAAMPARAQDDRVTVRLDGRPVLRVGPADTVDAADRALLIERRLATLLESPGALAPAQIGRSATDPEARVITVSGVPIVTVIRADADDNLTSVDGIATQWARALDDQLGRAAERRLSPGGRFGAEVQSAVRAAFSRLAESSIRVVPRGIAAVLVIVAFWLLAAVVRRLMRALFRRVLEDRTVESLMTQLVYYTIWVLGLIVAVDALGFQPQTVVTGLGLTGLALGFALKDIISNFVSGLLILSLRPFQLGDQIVVAHTEGAVERIRLRATEIRTYGGRLVLVPNAELFTSRVTNNTASPVRRGSVTVHLGYDADLRRAASALEDAAHGAPGVLDEPPVRVRVRELASDGIVFEVRFWADSRRSDFVATRSAVRTAAVDALRAAEIGLPEPTLRLLPPKD